EQGTLAAQIAGFVAAADTLLLGYGFAQRLAGILLIACAMPVLLLVTLTQFFKAAIPIAYVAMVLESKLRLSDAPLVTTFAARFVPTIFDPKGQALDLRDPHARESFRSISSRSSLRTVPAYVLYAVLAGQVTLFMSVCRLIISTFCKTQPGSA